MTWRLFKTAMQRGAYRVQFLQSLPLIALLQTVWALGEFVGYATSDPG